MRGKLLTPVVTLALLTILAGCASPIQATGRGTPTGAAEATQPTNPACLSMSHVGLNRGKPGGVSVDDIRVFLSHDNPIEAVRNLLGDTSETLIQVDANNAAWDSLCGGDGGGR